MVCAQVWCFWKAEHFTVPPQPCCRGPESEVPLPLCWTDVLHIWALDIHCRYSKLVILGSSGLAWCACICLLCRVIMKCVQGSWKEQVGIPTTVAWTCEYIYYISWLPGHVNIYYILRKFKCECVNPDLRDGRKKHKLICCCTTGAKWCVNRKITVYGLCSIEDLNKNGTNTL